MRRRWVGVNYWLGGRTIMARFYTRRGAYRWWRKQTHRGLIGIEKRNP